ncbi:MAG: NADH-quinone oxidoreductase subunit NuoH [Acidimicrobiales bacterium]
MGDPLFLHGVDLGAFVIAIVKVIVIFAFLMVSVMLMIWFERKVISDMQNRIGPNRAGPFGILQTLADGIKLFFKEDLLPERADPIVFKLAPYLALLPALLIFAIVPVGGVVHIAHHIVELQLADPQMGILFLLALSSVSVYGTMLAGWSSGSKYPLLGSVRASAQMISYEAAMGLTVAAVVLESHSLSTRAIVGAQAPAFWDWGVFHLWAIPFLIFWVAVTAELNRPPFDLTEGEQELVGGFHTEYSSLRFALFFLAEFMNVITMSAIIVTLFFGGPDGPGFHVVRWLWPILWFLGKTVVFLYVYVWIRAALPRLRYDQLMDIGWKCLIPLSLGWLLVIAAAQLSAAWGGGVAAGCIVAGGTLGMSLRVSRKRRELAADEAELGRAGAAPPAAGPAAGAAAERGRLRVLPPPSAAAAGARPAGEGGRA